MSIALSVVLRPSKIVQILAILFSLMLIFIAVYVAIGLAIPLFWRIFLHLICLCTSGVLWFNVRARNAKRWQIDVNDQGNIFCRSQSSVETQQTLQTSALHALVAGTTLWSDALFLRLRCVESARVINLMIFSDALSKEEFRRLSLACRWISARVN